MYEDIVRKIKALRRFATENSIAVIWIDSN
jgi:hypothetical protein